MARRPAPSRTYPRAVLYRAGPFLGMRDDTSPVGTDPRFASLIRNAYATSTEQGVRCVTGLPGFALAGTQLGSVGARACQWIGQFTQVAGTTKSLAFVNGELHEYDWGGNAWTTRLTQAEIAAGTGTPALSTTARIYCVVYNDQLIVSDGVNVPFQWDGTDSGGVVELSNCPVLYGQPTIHYEKLVGVMDAERDTIVWSEEGDPTLGYDTAPYENAWNLPGARAEPILALAARNESLGIIRKRTTTVVSGAIAAGFETTANRASVSDDTGTFSPGGVLVLDEGTVTVDQKGRPQFWVSGGGYTKDPAMWEACEATARLIAASTVPHMQVVLDEGTDLIWVTYAASGESALANAFLFERTGGTPNLVGVVTGVPMQRVGTWVDPDGRGRLVHAGVDDGYVYYHGTAAGDTWNYGFAAGTTPIPHEVQPAPLGADPDEEKNFDECTVEVMLDTSATLTVDFTSSDGTITDAQVLTFASAGMLWDDGLWDVGEWAGAAPNARGRIGIAAHGRWVRPSIRHSVLNETFCLLQCAILAFPEGRDPEIL